MQCYVGSSFILLCVISHFSQQLQFFIFKLEDNCFPLLLVFAARQREPAPHLSPPSRAFVLPL